MGRRTRQAHRAAAELQRSDASRCLSRRRRQEMSMSNQPCTDPGSQSRADGRRADLARRARVRHLFAPAQGTRHLPGRSDRRLHGQRDRRAAAVPRVGKSGQGHQPVHQQPGRRRSPPGMAIYDTMQFLKPDVSTICIGQAASMGSLLLAGRRQGQALRAAEFARHDPPAVAAASRARPPTSTSTRARSSTLRERLNEILVHAHRPADRADRARHRPRPLHERARTPRPTA